MENISFRQSGIVGNLQARAKILAGIRSFFTGEGYLEVETPVRIPAPAPETHIDPVASESWYLQTSPELCMKELLAAGLPKIFQLAKCFRKAERGRKHLPELTMLEWYQKDCTYRELMEETEEMVRHVAIAAGAGNVLTFQEKRIDLTGPWDRLTVKDAFTRYADVSMAGALASGTFDEVIGLTIEPQLGSGKPVFLYDYPAEMGALARLSPSDPTVAERFELYIAGVELCNAFTELNDPVEQRDRFEKEMAERKALGKPQRPMPERFLAALAHMPDAAGIALGVDRLVMLITDASAIDDVVTFTPEDLI